jgi:cytochrome c peroxidase
MKTNTLIGWTLLAALVFLSAFDPVPLPETPEELGERLFKDPILSSDRSVSCASCHLPAFAFADTSALSKGVGGQLGTRNTPGITNMGGRNFFFWDGRALTLEEQVIGPIENPVEMNLPMPLAIDRLNKDAHYRALFQQVYQKAPDSASITGALAAFMRTLETSDTPFDDWMNGDESAMSAEAIRGRAVFLVKARCFDCHFGPDFTVDEFRNIGLYNGKELNDVGRMEVTKKPEDVGKFKVPGLRNVALTAPYMHDGRFKTLREVIDYYDDPDRFGLQSIGRDTILQRPLQLTEQEKGDLEAFLHALTDRRFK